MPVVPEEVVPGKDGGPQPAVGLGLFHDNPLPMWIWSLRTFAILAVNEATAAFYGYTREELLAMTVRQLHAEGDSASPASPRLPKREKSGNTGRRTAASCASRRSVPSFASARKPPV